MSSAKATVAQLLERIVTLEARITSLEATRNHHPQKTIATGVDPEGVYPRVDGLGRRYRMSGYNVRSFAPEGYVHR